MFIIEKISTTSPNTEYLVPLCSTQIANATSDTRKRHFGLGRVSRHEDSATVAPSESVGNFAAVPETGDYDETRTIFGFDF